MRRGSGLQLKCPQGWFAAGREVAQALQLLSDATFKLFVWLCLHAERNRGVVSATPGELARALGKKEDDICLALEELTRQGICSLNAGVIEIRDRFWPYQRICGSSASEESQCYVAEVRRLFLQRRCVQSSFTAADEKLALSLFRRSIPLLQVERAILLGAVRKYGTGLQKGQASSSISSLHYFTNLFEEVRRQVSDNYWTYVAQKVKAFEQTWEHRTRRDPRNGTH